MIPPIKYYRHGIQTPVDQHSTGVILVLHSCFTGGDGYATGV
jgi:hypothetical protein